MEMKVLGTEFELQPPINMSHIQSPCYHNQTRLGELKNCEQYHLVMLLTVTHNLVGGAMQPKNHICT